MAEGLRLLGLSSGESVALFAENSSKWIVADQAIMMNGAIDAVRGSTAPLAELQQIVLNSDSVGLVLQDSAVLQTLLQGEVKSTTRHLNGFEQQQERFRNVMQTQMKFALVLWGDISTVDTSKAPFPIYTYDQLLTLGRGINKSLPFPKIALEDVATIVYTSGTSGVPKGVTLTHGNIIYQINAFDFILHLYPGEQVLSLLPPWHIYERSVAYYIFCCGCSVLYSSVKTLKADLAQYPTAAFITVPLVLDTLYKNIMKQLHTAMIIKRVIALNLLKASMAYVAYRRVVEGMDLRFARQPRPLVTYMTALIMLWLLAPLHWISSFVVSRAVKKALGIDRLIISGGGSLAGHLDLFYEAIGMPVLNGWGMTEMSPVICCRLPYPGWNVRGSVGPPIKETEVKIVNPETMEELEDGVSGVILARGPGVMEGYRKDPEETQRVLLPDGWLNTGDRGWMTPEGIRGSKMAGNVVLTGRAKDTIVLSNGENIEPQPIEDWLQVSPMISHIMVLGQDKRQLGALVVADPESFKDGTSRRMIEETISHEIWITERQNPAFVSHMHIAAIQLLDDPFSVDDGTLTKTMKVRREAVLKRFAAEVEQLEKRIR